MSVTAKPSAKPEWATDGGALVTEPPSPKKAQGWIVEKPPVRYWNWLLKFQYLWIDYLENMTDRISSEYDAIVGSIASASYSTIEAAITAGAKNILVISPITLTQDVTLGNDVTIRFKPLATITKGGTATRGLIVDGRRVRIYDGRMLGFTGGSDIGVLLTVNAKDCLVSGTMFQNATTKTVDDLGSNNSFTNLIEEIA